MPRKSKGRGVAQPGSASALGAKFFKLLFFNFNWLNGFVNVSAGLLRDAVNPLMLFSIFN